MLKLLQSYSDWIIENYVSDTFLRLLNVAEGFSLSLSTLLFTQMKDLEFIIFLSIVYPLEDVLHGVVIMLGRIPEGWVI